MHKVLLVSLLLLLPGHALDAFAQGRDAGRDEWNRPEDVMDALGARPGSVIADIGAGFGYFTFHLAARVGPTGHVYATDIRNRRLEVIRQRVAQERLTQVHVMIGANDDPLLPVESVDAILLSNAYHDFTDYNAMMEGMFRSRGAVWSSSTPTANPASRGACSTRMRTTFPNSSFWTTPAGADLFS